jgi:hypothetical protein
MIVLNRKKTKSSILVIIIIILFFNIITATVSTKLSTGSQENSLIQNKNEETSYDLLVISPNEFYQYLLPLISHKNSYGVKTKLVTVGEIYQQILLRGRDNAEKIKYFIKDEIEKWEIKYVLLVGGRKDQSAIESWWVPVRYSYLSRKYGNWFEGRFLCDLYFADIYDSEGGFSSWNNNDNSLFGEWPENSPAVDIPDLYPDVAVGRLPCRNVFEVKTIVNKIIRYETGNFQDSWFNKMLVVAGDTYPEKSDYIDGEVYTQMALDMMPGFTPVKVWASEGTLTNWRSIVKEINNGCGFVHFSGHGGPYIWNTYRPYDSSERIGNFKLRHMLFLFNRNKLPVCISGSGCFNNMFNVSLGHSEWVYWNGKILNIPISIPFNIPKCWGWSLTCRTNGGGIAVIASTAFSYESPDISRGEGGCEWLDMHFFEQYGINGTDILGKCWADTVTGFLQNFSINWSDTTDIGDALIVKNVEQWILIGDPSLKIGGYN